jgi:hypothetical protein
VVNPRQPVFLQIAIHNPGREKRSTQSRAKRRPDKPRIMVHATATATGEFTGTMSFTVTGLPSGATGTFNPANVAGSGQLDPHGLDRKFHARRAPLP